MCCLGLISLYSDVETCIYCEVSYTYMTTLYNKEHIACSEM